MRVFAQLTKVDAEKRLVYGRACAEVPDRSGEIFDYEKSKPYFQAWSDNIQKDTDGKSFGNIRAMHGKVSAGKVVEPLSFNDAEKAIDIVVKVVDDNEWNKTIEGCYTGFSIGGSYIGERTTEKMADGTEVKRYVAEPTEISLVDQPCVPTAKFFDIRKADGTVEKVAFKAAALEVQGSDADVEAFAKALNDAGLTMADATALIKAGKKPADNAVDKGMWNVQDFASALASISYIAASAQDESDWEGDKSPVPEKLRAWLKTGVDIFKAMAKEEADELVASLKGKAGKALGVTLELHKLARVAPVELTAEEIAAVTKATSDKLVLGKALDNAAIEKGTKATMQAVHDMVKELGGMCAPAKAEPTGDLAKVQEQLAKALTDIDALKKQPATHVMLRTVAVAKGTEQPDATSGLAAELAKVTRESLTDVEKLKNADGSIDWKTSLFVKSQQVEQAFRARANS